MDYQKLKKDNPITDPRALMFVSIMLLCVFIALFTSPIHGQEPAWLCFLGMCVSYKNSGQAYGGGYLDMDAVIERHSY